MGPDAARAAAAKIARKAKDDEVAQTLVTAWSENDKLLRLEETAKALATEHDLEKLLNDIIDAAIGVMGAERGFLMLADETGVLQVQVARNIGQTALDDAEMKVSTSIATRAFTSGASVLTSNAEEDDRFEGSQSIMAFQLRSILCAPLTAQSGAIGVIYMDNRSAKGIFDVADQRLLELFGGQAAVALENARLHGELLASRDELDTQKRHVEELNRRLAERLEKQQVELVEVRRSLDASHRDLALKYNYDRIIGTSPKMQEIFRLLDRTTDTSVSVLIVGESGTGKELVAKAIHFNGPRKNKPFAAENVSAISETLLESELFGHVRGSFTGAVTDKLGLFEVANGGTLFLDEIGDMSKNLQAKLLRALQEGEIRRVGGKSTIKVDVRIVSATNRNLEEMIGSGDFRQDLYYRLNVIKVTLPPLRERREDVPLLVDHFLEQMASDGKQPKRAISDEALRLLMAYDWPGNVRELENEISRAVVLSDDQITPSVLSERICSQAAAGPAIPTDLNRPLKDVVEELEKHIILNKLEETAGNKSATAKALGLSRDGLRKKLIRYRLGTDEESAHS